ncbi:unnamed protein product [Sphagnum balticum]
MIHVSSTYNLAWRSIDRPSRPLRAIPTHLVYETELTPRLAASIHTWHRFHERLMHVMPVSYRFGPNVSFTVKISSIGDGAVVDSATTPRPLCQSTAHAVERYVFILNSHRQRADSIADTNTMTYKYSKTMQASYRDDRSGGSSTSSISDTHTLTLIVRTGAARINVFTWAYTRKRIGATNVCVFCEVQRLACGRQTQFVFLKLAYRARTAAHVVGSAPVGPDIHLCRTCTVGHSSQAALIHSGYD